MEFQAHELDGLAGWKGRGDFREEAGCFREAEGREAGVVGGFRIEREKDSTGKGVAGGDHGASLE